MQARLIIAFITLACAACYPHYRHAEMVGKSVKKGTALEKRGKKALAEKRYAAAERYFERAIRTHVVHAQLYLNLAEAQAGRGHHEEARTTARYGLTRHPAGWVKTQLQGILVDTYAAEGLYSVALDELTSASLVQAMGHPDLGKVFRDLSSAKSASNPDQVLEHYAKWLSTYGEPDHPLVRRWADDALRDALPRSREMLSAGKRHARAGEHTHAVRRLAQAYRYMPRSVFEREGQNTFIASCQKVRPLSGLSPTARRVATVADRAWAKRDLPKALGEYRRAVAMAPWWPEVRRNFAVALAGAGSYQEAARQMEWYLRLAPTAPQRAKHQELAADWRGKRR